MILTTAQPATTSRKHSLYAPKCDLVYGASGVRKTSNIGLLALYYWEKFHKRTRLVSADGGGWEPLQPLVDEGIIEPWMVASHRFPLTALNYACEGYWPVDVDDPTSQIKSVPLDDIALLAIEGLTSAGDMMLQWFGRTGQRLSQDPSYSYSDGGKSVNADGRETASTWYGANMSQYGEVQRQLYSMVMKSNRLPVEKVMWTALEGKGEDEGGEPIYGPAIAGKKSTGKAPQWFGNCIHIEALTTVGATDKDTKQAQVITKPVMYLRSHADPVRKIPFHCKTRAPFQFAGELPEYLDPPDMAELYRRLEVLQQKARESLKK